uniref:TSC22 domain family protein 3 n=1 Tax=Amphiprion ocellaris TaxID=80972 RepID=A0AAQ5ZGY9_AMPOC
MSADVKKTISRQQVSDSVPRSQRRPPSTPPLPLRTWQLVAKQPETAVVLRDRRKVRGHVSGVRESWPTATTHRCLTPPSRAQPITEARPRPTNQPRPLRPSAPPPAAPHPHWSVPGRGSDSTMMSLLLFCHSSSSNSLIAIDNKIEQAMDLVKSHLMLAVREEVELLREQIRDLQEKNQQLERENHILRALTHNLSTTQH